MTPRKKAKRASAPKFCGARTKQGTRCRAAVAPGEKRCWRHRETTGRAKREARRKRPEGPARTARTKTAAPDDVTAPDTVLVAIVHDAEADKRTLLQRAVAEGGLWTLLTAARRAHRCNAAKLSIVIKPDLEVFDQGAPTGTDPELVAHLIDLLHDEGYSDVVVADALHDADAWAENRDVPVLADLAGYRYVTEAGRDYDVVNLSEDPVPFAKEGDRADSVLDAPGIARVWRDARFRIGFAKNKTDEAEGYALGVHNALGALPLREKRYHYRHRLAAGDVAQELLERTPLDFALIDATVSNHGGAGTRRIRPLATATIIASADVLLADWLGALKMGLDPYVNRTNAALLRGRGLPRRYRVIGDASPYPGWRNAPVLWRRSVQARNRSYSVARMVEPWLQEVNRELFPFKNEIDERMNEALQRLTMDFEDQPLRLGAMTAVNFWLGNLAELAESWRILYGKDYLRHRDTPLGFDPAAYPAADYAAVADYMQPLADLVAQTPPDRNGLKWRYIDESVLFEFQRLIDRPYDEFVARVDIARAVQTMNDYIGGARVPVERDAQGRVVRQAERNIYLPQPNWLALFGGRPIDVGKLELVRYEKDRQEIFWRTITSANDSAEFDDGIVTFARHESGATDVTIVARQKFALPPLLELAHLENFPAVKDTLVSDAYVTYFSRTVANFVAIYEGRDARIGRPWATDLDDADRDADRGGESLGGVETGFAANPVAQFTDAVHQLVALLEPLLARKVPAAETATADATDVDEHGFRHFPGRGEGGAAQDADAAGGVSVTRVLADFLSELSGAVRKDLTWRHHGAGEDRS